MILSREWIQKLVKHQMVHSALMLYGVQFSSYIFPLLTLPYLSRVLSPDRFGLIAFAQSFIWYFVTLTEYGFNMTATRRIAVERDNPKAVSLTFNSVIAAKVLLCVIGFLMMAVTVALVPRLRPDWILYFICYLSVVGSTLFPLWLFQGLQKLQHVALRDFGVKLLALIAVFALVRRESDYLIAAAIPAGALAVAGLIGLAMAPKIASVRFAIPPWHEVAAQLREGFPVFISMTAMALYGSTNTFILGLVSNNTEVGHFSGAWRVIVALRMLVGPLVTTIYPHISRVAARSQADAIRFLRRYSLILSAPFLAGGVVLFLSAPRLIPLLLGPKYQASIVLIQIMAFSPFLCSLANCYSTYYMLPFGYDKQWTQLILWGIPVNFVVLLPLLWLIQPAQAVALATTGLDLYAFIAPFIFYLRTSRKLMAKAPGAPASIEM